jgi:hypothetical protein
MSKAGVIVLFLTGALAGLSLLGWLVGLLTGFGGSLIHLLLIIALLVAPLGIAAGVVLLVVGKRQGAPR